MSGAFDLAGRRAVVTGGGRGIGAAVAAALAAGGASLVLAARTGREIDAVAARLAAAGATAHAVACDVTEPESVARLAREAERLLGGVDILVNNAGVAASAPLRSVSLAEWNRILAVNATGVFLCAQAMLPGMLARGWGRIVNVASVAARIGAAYITAYAASKHAVLGFTRSLAAEVAAKGVTVNAVCPGYVDTPMTDQSIARIVEKTGAGAAAVRERLAAMSPQHRLFQPDEVAFAVAFLCDERARGVNGQALVLDGGALLA